MGLIAHDLYLRSGSRHEPPRAVPRGHELPGRGSAPPLGMGHVVGPDHRPLARRRSASRPAIPPGLRDRPGLWPRPVPAILVQHHRAHHRRRPASCRGHGVRHGRLPPHPATPLSTPRIRDRSRSSNTASISGCSRNTRRPPRLEMRCRGGTMIDRRLPALLLALGAVCARHRRRRRTGRSLPEPAGFGPALGLLDGDGRQLRPGWDHGRPGGDEARRHRRPHLHGGGRGHPQGSRGVHEPPMAPAFRACQPGSRPARAGDHHARQSRLDRLGRALGQARAVDAEAGGQRV